MQDPSAPRLILVLQSDPAHVSVIRDVLAHHELQPQLVAIADPQAALDYLHRQGEYATAQRPDLILLDLELGHNAEGMAGASNGYELLATIKGDARLRRIPIIVLTLSDCPDDIFNTYAIQGNCYVIHPSDRDQLTHILRRIEDFWLNIVTLPQE
ncbi:response regulator [Leptolyngbya iicbica]|uniref:Response regulator n=2 Tax=Cyanophyceae TaxID=3028117 RepID=A0A4Q7E2Y4_9CYAN|nr:response regulator [Leptolyngbya sp. LK]RZM75651.1 response regulator [Leptolyngbya sp. LK]